MNAIDQRPSVGELQPICPTNTCSRCPNIPRCDAPKTRLLQFGSDLNVLPVAPLDKHAAVWQPPPRLADDSDETPKPFCPVQPRKFYDNSYVVVIVQSTVRPPKVTLASVAATVVISGVCATVCMCAYPFAPF